MMRLVLVGKFPRRLFFTGKLYCVIKITRLKRLNDIYADLLAKAHVDIIAGCAAFIDDHTIEVAGQTITADHILIATGAKPIRPTFPGAEHVVVSDDMFFLSELPRHALIQGGGYVAVEFAHILHGLGVEVTLVYRGPQFLKSFDQDIGPFLAAEMEKKGIELCFQ